MRNKPAEIRKATKKDWKGYFTLKKEEESYYNHLLKRNLKFSKKVYYREFIQKLASKKAILLVAIKKKQVAGYLHGTFFKNSYNRGGFIEELFISQVFRKKGFANQLVKKFIKVVKSRRLELVQLSVNVKNRRAVRFYKKLGFEIYHLDFRKFIKRI